MQNRNLLLDRIFLHYQIHKRLNVFDIFINIYAYIDEYRIRKQLGAVLSPMTISIYISILNL